MTMSCEETDTILESLMLDATNEIAVSVEVVVSEFITSGGYGSLRMHIMSNDRIAKAFRSAARLMAVQARACAGGNGAAAADLVEAHLFVLINRTIEKRIKHLAAGRVAFQDAEILCADLRHDLKRLKDATVRDLRHLSFDMPIEAGLMAERGSAVLYVETRRPAAARMKPANENELVGRLVSKAVGTRGTTGPGLTHRMDNQTSAAAEAEP